MGKTIEVFVLVGTMLLVLSGCSSENERLADFAENSVEQQSQQNREMVELNRDVADAIQAVSEDQRQSREEYTELLSQIQVQHERVEAETSKLAAERREMAVERKEIEQTRRRDAVLAPIVKTIGGVLLCLLPLLVAWKLLSHNCGDDTAAGALVELLTNELVAERPLLQPPPTDGSLLARPLIEENPSENTE